MTTKAEEAVQTMTVLTGLLILAAIVYIISIFSLKLLGIILLIVGTLSLIFFPGITGYQTEIFAKTMRKISISLIIIGIILTIFG